MHLEEVERVPAVFDECPGCRDEDDDDDFGPGHDTHRLHDARCVRHRPTQVNRLRWCHVESCDLCRADIRQEIAIELTYRQLAAVVGDNACGKICSLFLAHREPNEHAVSRCG